VLLNLLTNAVKYSPDGGDVVVTVRQEHVGTGDMAGDLAGETAMLAVQDGGIGIPATDLPHIFERFYRASNVGGRSRGTGLGLSAVQQIVEQHGGTITAESEPGVGTTITVRLPLHEEIAPATVGSVG
jgi:signal transduction histidine kinase